MSFTYSMLGQVVGLIGSGVGVILFDISGRRPLMILGSMACTFLLYLASGLGSINKPNGSETNTIVACFILLPAFVRISASNNAFLTGAEIGGVRMRKKIMVSQIFSSLEVWLFPDLFNRLLEQLAMSLLLSSSRMPRPTFFRAWASTLVGSLDPWPLSRSSGPTSSSQNSR